MIFLFFFCLPMVGGYYDCSYNVWLEDVEDINERWILSGNKGWITGMFDGYKNIYIPDMKYYHHEWRHAFCENHYNNYNDNHTYCLDPHFKVQR